MEWNSVTRVRISTEDRALLEQYAQEHELTLSEILRIGYRQIIYERNLLDDEDAGYIYKTYSLPTKKDGVYDN